MDSFDKPTPNDCFFMERRNRYHYETYDSMRYYKSFLHTGMMSMDPQTGHVKAWVGGINYETFSV